MKNSEIHFSYSIVWKGDIFRDQNFRSKTKSFISFLDLSFSSMSIEQMFRKKVGFWFPGKRKVFGRKQNFLALGKQASKVLSRKKPTGDGSCERHANIAHKENRQKVKLSFGNIFAPIKYWMFRFFT